MEFARGVHSEAAVMAVVSANFHRAHLGLAFPSHPMKQLTMEATRDAHEAHPAGVPLPCQMLVTKGLQTFPTSLELSPGASPASQCLHARSLLLFTIASFKSQCQALDLFSLGPRIQFHPAPPSS